ncbi:DinB family protein [Brevibacillus borstelensis]
MVKRLIEDYANGSEKLRRSIHGLTTEEMSFKPGPEKWSIHEIIVHICDAEIVGVQRMKKVLAEDRPLLTGYDQDAWARSLGYSQQNAERALQLFQLLREEMASVLQRVKDEEGGEKAFTPKRVRFRCCSCWSAMSTMSMTIWHKLSG